MKIIFFEVQPWEEEILKKEFPDAAFTKESLTKENAPHYKDAVVVSTFIYSKVDRETIDLFPNLKCITTRSTGYDHIDVSFCKGKNIVVTNVPEYGSATVAEHTFALLLSLTRKIYQSVNQAKQLNFNHNEIRGVDLYGKTIGIIGLGKIGQHVLKIAQGFGMHVLVYNRSQKPELAVSLNFKYVDLPTLLKASDVITLHMPLTNETKHIINKTNILNCKKGSYLINTARGPLIETEALVLALEQNILEGVALDVLEEEKELGEEAEILTSTYKESVDLKTLVYDHMLINHPKVLITPHNAFNSKEALMRILLTTMQNIQAFLKGAPVNTVTV